MDKHTLGVIVWLILLAALILSVRAIVKAYSTGEVDRSKQSGYFWKTIRRDTDPAGFQLYMLGLVVMNVFFLICVIALGIVIFFGK